MKYFVVFIVFGFFYFSCNPMKTIADMGDGLADAIDSELQPEDVEGKWNLVEVLKSQSKDKYFYYQLDNKDYKLAKENPSNLLDKRDEKCRFSTYLKFHSDMKYDYKDYNDECKNTENLTNLKWKNTFDKEDFFNEITLYDEYGSDYISKFRVIKINKKQLVLAGNFNYSHVFLVFDKEQ